MIWGIIKLIGYLFYIPKCERTCENGYHKWGKWERYAVTYQINHCTLCNREIVKPRLRGYDP
jgi:NAD-dependent SIR2 family protein deacetylase